MNEELDIMEPVAPKPVVELKIEQIIIPQCCRENWPTCTHVPKRQRKVKRNIGL